MGFFAVQSTISIRHPVLFLIFFNSLNVHVSFLKVLHEFLTKLEDTKRRPCLVHHSSCATYEQYM